MIGLTAKGRTTIQTLKLNRPYLINQRVVYHAYGIHPPNHSKIWKLLSNLCLKNQFWKFIKLIDWQQKENEKILQPTINALANSDESIINQFSENLALYLHQLDGPAYTKAFAANELGFSADTFLYARCLAVAKGEKFYKKVLAKPENMPVGEDFETLLSVAEEAYLQKTGKIYQYVSTINYESFFNQQLWVEKAIVL